MAMSLPRLYVETTIPSYLTAWPSGNTVIAGHQETTKEWWATCHERFELHVSQFVLDEAGAGDPEAARLRLEVLRGMPELPATEAALTLATALMAEGAVPEKARTDAAHIAVAAVHGMDFLVTWNCRHIANAAIQARLRKLADASGFTLPVICTPEELLENENEQSD